MNSIMKKIILASMGLLAGTLFAQQSNTMYFMDNVPQSNQLNPAFQTYCNVYVGFPALNFSTYAGNGAIRLSDVLILNGNDSLDFFSASDNATNSANTDKFFKRFSKKNLFYSHFDIDLINFGFRYEKTWFFTFNFSEKVDVKMALPLDMISLALYGIRPNENNLDFSGLAFNASVYKELAFGASKIIDDQWTVGGKAKFLFGDLNISSKYSKIKFSNLGYDNWNVNMNTQLNISIPDVSMGIADNGFYDFASLDLIDTAMSAAEYAISNFAVPSFKNFGFAIDAGAEYKMDEKLSLSASLLDLGFIRWGRNPYNMKFGGSKDYIGIPRDTAAYMEEFIDTLIQDFKVATANETYTTWLSGKLYLAGSYQFTPEFGLGLLSRSELYQRKVYQQFTLAANYSPVNGFTISPSYSFINNRLNGLGVGLAYRVRWFNMYLLADNVPFQYSKDMLPYKIKYANFRFGINLMFGCHRIKDYPSVLD